MFNYISGYKIDVDDNDNYIYGATQKIITQIVADQDKETLKAIFRYCEENNVYSNIISEDKLKLILQLGIAEYNKRYKGDE